MFGRRHRTTGTAMHTRPYEAVYILPGALTAEEIDPIVANFKEVVEKNGGTVTEAGLWQKRRLAYPIDDHRDGNYILMNFTAPSEAPAELSRLLDISDSVIRHRIFKIDPRTEGLRRAPSEEEMLAAEAAEAERAEPSMLDMAPSAGPEPLGDDE